MRNQDYLIFLITCSWRGHEERMWRRNQEDQRVSMLSSVLYPQIWNLRGGIYCPVGLFLDGGRFRCSHTDLEGRVRLIVIWASLQCFGTRSYPSNKRSPFSGTSVCGYKWLQVQLLSCIRAYCPSWLLLFLVVSYHFIKLFLNSCAWEFWGIEDLLWINYPLANKLVLWIL